MNFSRFLDIQSWWEVPSIAYFCSLFRTAFNLLDFDIEELEEALLTDGTEESASSLLTELIVRLLNGCLGNNDISAFNYQMYLRRLFRQKCQDSSRYNPFNTDIDFQFLPLRTKVEILYALCNYRLDAEDVFELFRNLEAESLRVEPLGWDDNDSAYWYFYGTRLYREDIIKKGKPKHKKKKSKENRKRGWFYGDDWLDDDETERVWQVVCFTEEDWTHLTEKFSKATTKIEKELYRSLSQNFLPEIPRLFQEKERLQRKRLLELAPRRTSSRVLQKIKQKEEEVKQTTDENKDQQERKETPDLARENRAKRRNLMRSKSASSDSSGSSESEKVEMPQKVSKRSKSHEKRSKHSSTTHKGEPPPEPPVKTGRKTNNSLASATGQILIPDNDEPVNSTRKKLKTSQIQTEEDIQTDMYKVLEQLTAHEDAWPFMDPVEEEYAPNYYAVIRRPMDLHKMEERLDSRYYTDFSMFKADFKLIVNNCRLYNGQDNEYTTMVDKLQAAFDRLTEKYIHRLSSSDEEIAVEYQLPTPSRKHKLKSSESSDHHKRKKRKSQSDTGEPKSSLSESVPEEEHEEPVTEVKKSKESHKSKQGKGKKKRKSHRHGKHSKNHKKNIHKSEHGVSKSKHSKKQKHGKNKDGKKSKQKKKKSKHHEAETSEVVKRSASQESLESSNRSRSASPLPSIHTPSPSPTEADPPEPTEQLNDPDFFKDKYDKIKERRRNAAKDAWDSLFDYKQKVVDKQKQNVHVPEREKNQKLRETIEKLKAKNEKYKDNSLFNTLFTPSHSSADRQSEQKNTKEPSNNDEEEDNIETQKVKSGIKKKKNAAKNESASEALEQAVKDISKWLDDAPKGSTVISPCDSPAHTVSTEEHDNKDDEITQGEKPQLFRKDISRKRPSSREPKMIKRREIQRTIDRLQPGKSKGNLLTNMTNKNVDKPEEVAPSGVLNKARDCSKAEESSPKLSLGSVLPTVEFPLGNDLNFSSTEESKSEDPKEVGNATETVKEVKGEETPHEKKSDDTLIPSNKKDAEVETDPNIPMKPSQEKATPNLSAWFKAFGAPKNVTTTPTTKKKVDDSVSEEKAAEVVKSESKPTIPKITATVTTSTTTSTTTTTTTTAKYDSPTDPEVNPEGGDSPLTSATPRQRRTSTGSSVSERSSFSQDLDSPRHQMSHTSPLLCSPASPRTDDYQKNTYPINGSVRAGFYQDTTSIKSSPEKSCSPREAPQSPYSPYSQHVYASNSASGSSTPGYLIAKSPLPTYGQNPPPFYDSSKVRLANKSARCNEDYTALGPDSFQQNQYTGPFSPTYLPYSQTPPSNYSAAQRSPQPSSSTNTPTPASTTQITAEPKTPLFPVKKRAYNEPENSTKLPEHKDCVTGTANKKDYQKFAQNLHSLSSLSTPSVDDIALALSEKSQKVAAVEFMDRHVSENKDGNKSEKNVIVHDKKKDSNSIEMNKFVGIMSQENVDMVNMGYMNPEIDRRTLELREVEYATSREVLKSRDIEAVAINLGINSQQVHKAATKSNALQSNIPPAHSQDRSHHEISLNQSISLAHHNQYDSLSGGQSISNFSMNDIDLANKKLYTCNAQPATAIDYGNWKISNQMRNQEILPSDYSVTYSSASADKSKSEINTSNANAINYNKNLQQQQYNAYNVARSNIQRAQEIQQSIPAELRIPNPRGLIKNDHISSSSSISDVELISKNIDTIAKSQKPEKLVQNHPLVNSNPYKTPYSNHSPIPLESLRNLPNIPQMLERYTNDERYLSTFAGTASSIYHEKQFQMAQMFNKSMTTDSHPASTSVSIYSQPSISISKDNSIYKTSSISTSQADMKMKNKRKRTSEIKQSPIVGSQAYHSSPCGNDVLSSVKSSMMPGSAFNFGASANMALAGGLYSDSPAFTIDDFRNSTANQLMAANYMVAAVAHQQRNNAEANADKLAKPAHQNSSHAAGAFPFIGHAQARAGYPFADPSYQQYFQRHQEELLRQTGAQIMSLYPPGYPASLGVRQPYDSINRPSWL